MKGKICLLLAVFICVLFFGCAKSDDTQKSAVYTDSKAENAESEMLIDETTAEQTETQTDISQNGDIDIDLTAMSQTVMYAEMSNMQIDPDSYKGKTVKIRGQYNAYQNDDKTKWYYAVVVQDATACCQQGMEFEFSDGKAPTCITGDEIEVSGIFDAYTEKVQNLEILHCVLKNAEIRK